jgi:hypothetical protein
MCAIAYEWMMGSIYATRWMSDHDVMACMYPWESNRSTLVLLFVCVTQPSRFSGFAPQPYHLHMYSSVYNENETVQRLDRC